MVKIYDKKYFEDLSEDDIEEFISDNKNLIGSAIFTKNESLMSKIVRFFEEKKCKDKAFIPSHVGSIIKYDNEYYIFNMKPLRGKLTLLYDYLLMSDDDFEIVERNFKLNCKKFTEEILKHVGEFYPFLSAINSIMLKIKTKKSHCSECHLKALQKQKILKDINPEITPDELYHVLIERK